MPRTLKMIRKKKKKKGKKALHKNQCPHRNSAMIFRYDKYFFFKSINKDFIDFVYCRVYLHIICAIQVRFEKWINGIFGKLYSLAKVFAI